MLLINKTPNLQTVKIAGEKVIRNRIWLEGKKLARYVAIGTKYLVKDTSEGIIVKFDETLGSKIVSKRSSKGEDKPLIEINESNSAFLRSISNNTMLRIAITHKGIKVTINNEVVDHKIAEREQRIIRKSKSGEKIEIGSVFAGGGTFDYSGHKGFERSKLSTVVRLAVDYDETAVENLIENVSHIFDSKSLIIQSDLTLLDYNKNLPLLDVLKLTPPCIDSSKAGKAKKGNTCETKKTASLVFYYLKVIELSNPAFILLENVKEFMDQVSFKMLQSMLLSWGYSIQTRIINSFKEGFSLEARERMYMVAESIGLEGSYDIADVMPLSAPEKRLGDILDAYSLDNKAWTPKTGLIEKEKRDIAKGNGFRMRKYTEECTSIATLRAGYQKSGSADPLIVHPEGGLYRILNKDEHASAKGIDIGLVKGRTEGEAHRILGNGLISSIAESLCYQLGLTIQSLKDWSTGSLVSV